MSFEPADGPTIAGDSASIPVRVLSPDGKLLGETKWEFVKLGDQWKIKHAPLP